MYHGPGRLFTPYIGQVNLIGTNAINQFPFEYLRRIFDTAPPPHPPSREVSASNLNLLLIIKIERWQLPTQFIHPICIILVIDVVVVVFIVQVNMRKMNPLPGFLGNIRPNTQHLDSIEKAGWHSFVCLLRLLSYNRLHCTTLSYTTIHRTTPHHITLLHF